jgi:hypothetical protein
MRQRLRSLSRSQWLLMLAAGLIGGITTALVTANPKIFPNLEAGGKPRKPPLYAGRVIQPNGEWAYVAPQAQSGLRAEHASYNAPLKFSGYCIGAPTTRHRLADVPDQRWLVLGNARVMPKLAVTTNMPLSTLTPVPCPGAPRDSGPTAVTLLVTPRGDELALRARAPRAVTVGFVAFGRRSRRWNQIGLVSSSGEYFNASTPRRDTVVTMAVVCWAADEPGHPHGELLYALKPLGTTPERPYVEADDTSAEGSRRACSVPKLPSVPRPRKSNRPPTHLVAPPPAREAPIKDFAGPAPVRVVPTTKTSTTIKRTPHSSHQSEPEGSTIVPPSSG